MADVKQKAYIGARMEGSVARWYEKTTRRDLAEFRALAKRLDALLPAGGDVLEVAPGPGFLSVELARNRALHVIGLDISKTFVEISSKNAIGANVTATFVQGNASDMPFDDNSFDLLVCRAAFKNFSEPKKALAEMRRVLRPGGTGLIIDLRRDASMVEIADCIDRMKLSPWNRLLTLLIFRYSLIKRAYTRQEMEGLLDNVGFSNTEVRIADIGMEIWLKK